MAKVHGGVPFVWDDIAAPAHAAGAGSASPNYAADFIAATGGGGGGSGNSASGAGAPGFIRIYFFTAYSL